jgi:hypothetical protein
MISHCSNITTTPVSESKVTSAANRALWGVPDKPRQATNRGPGVPRTFTCWPDCCLMETAVSDDNVESYQLPSHRLELPIVLAQDSIASIESVDLEPIPESVV